MRLAWDMATLDQKDGRIVERRAEIYLRLAFSRAHTASLDNWFDDMCIFFKLGHVRPRPSIKVTISVQSPLCCVKHNESSFILGQFITCKKHRLQWTNAANKLVINMNSAWTQYYRFRKGTEIWQPKNWKAWRAQIKKIQIRATTNFEDWESRLLRNKTT